MCKAPEFKFKDIQVKVCACQRVFDRGQWLHKELNQFIASLVQSQVKPRLKVNANIDESSLKKGKNTVKITAQHNKDTYQLPVKISVQQCHFCQRLKTGYFQGVLQLRNASNNAEAFIEKEVLAAFDKGVFISKKVPYEDGFDYYLSDNRFLQTLGKKLQEHYGGILKVNARIHTHDNARSKDVYRMTVLVELPRFKSGDVIKVGESLIWVQQVAKEVCGVDLKLHKKLKFPFKSAAFEIMPKYKTQVTKLYPHVEVLNPLDYQSIMVKNGLRTPEPNKEVEVVIDKGVYVIE